MCNTEMTINIKKESWAEETQTSSSRALTSTVRVPLYECFILRARAELEQLAKLKEMKVALNERTHQASLLLPRSEYHHVVQQTT